MNKMIFPSNPENGMIFEATVGLFFQYDASDHSWIRIDGINALGLATPIQNGLMDNEDLIKLNGLIIPPPQASLKGEDCGIVFNSGRIKLASTDKSLEIRHTRDVVTKENGETIIEELPWQIHENTGGYDFKLNVEAFIAELEELSRLTRIRIQGAEGPAGITGNDGQDNLDTGPVGEPGLDGANSEFGGTLQPEVINVDIPEDLKNRAIVDIGVEQSDDGNFLVLTRANINDPESCLELIKGNSFFSPWVVVVDESEPKIIRRLVKASDCTAPCLICNTSLYHLYIQPIITAINDRFTELTIRLKDEKERLFRIWMDAMIQLFNEQKASLCCALENCTTRKRNTTDRRYIETQRIQAAISKHNLIIDGEEDKTIIDTNVDRDCGEQEKSCDISNNCNLGLECNIDQESLEWPFGSEWQYSVNGGPFSLGTAPFGSGSGPSRHPDNGRTGNSPFPLSSTLVIKKSLGTAVKSLTVTFQVDDFADVVVNGITVYDEPDAGDAGRMRAPITVVVPESVFVAGENEVMIIGRDSGLEFSWLDAALVWERGSIDCELPADLPIITNPFLNRIEWNEGCGMDVIIKIPQLVRLTKMIGDSSSFEMVDPGPGLTIGAKFRKIYVSAIKQVENASFRVRLLDNLFNLYSFPFKTIDTIREWQFIEFNSSEMDVVDSDGSSRSSVMRAGTTIIAMIIDVDAVDVRGRNEDPTVMTFSSITLLDETGAASVLSGFEWGGDSDALRAEWSMDCDASPITSICTDCLLTATVDPTIYTNNERALSINLPAGEYEAEITDCCAELSNGIFSGRVSIEYQTSVGDATTTAPTQDAFVNLGNFSNLQRARAAYIGSTLPFIHAGGPLKLWINDSNAATSDNTGSIDVCIKPQICNQPAVTGTGGTGVGVIFVYLDSINPNNLIGSINPFNGTLTAIDNYGYGDISAANPNIQEGPTPEAGTTQIWFYNGTDGLSAVITNGITGAVNNINIGFKVTGNSAAQTVLVSDDIGELSTVVSSTAESSFSANWTNSTDIDGGMIGYFDNTDNSGWVLEVTPTDLGGINRFVTLSGTGEDVELSFATDGIGTNLAANKIIFTRLVNGCQMFYKQVEWLERGHRIGAACSAVVTIDSTKYIVVKRSIGTDVTCGGGETLANQCVSTFINSGDGHPAIAWPTFNNQEFIGLPTSGFQGFIQDPALSDQILAKIQAGDMEEPINGDPATEIPFILFPSSF